MQFGHLSVDDAFIYKNHKYIVIHLEMRGCCSPDFNAIDANTGAKTLLHHLWEVEKVEQYLTSIHNKDWIESWTLPTDVIHYSDQVPVWNKTSFCTPLIEDRFVEYEETDTWLIHFGLATKKVVPYYEKFENREWRVKYE